MKKIYKPHPLMIIRFLKPFLFVLLLPVIRAPLEYLIKGEINGLLNLEIAAFVVIFLIAIMRFLNFRVICDNDKVLIKSGFLIKSVSEIEIEKLSSVQTIRNPIDIIFGAMTFCVNTEAGMKNKPDFEFKLKFSDSKELAKRLYGEETVSKQRFSAVKVAIMAAATSSAFTGMIIGVPVINRAGNLLGIALSEMLLNEINNVSSKIETKFPPIVNTVSLIFLLAYAVSFVYLFLKYVNFRIIFGENKLEVRTGLISKKRTAFKKDSVNNVKIEQTALMLLFRRFSMKVSVGGFGETKGESQVIVPSGRYGELEADFYRYFPFLAPDAKYIKPKRSILSESRFLYWPAVWLIVVLGASIATAVIFEEFTRLILFVSFVLHITVFYYAYLCVLEYKYSEASFGNNIFARSKKALRTFELYCPREKVGQIKITRFFTDFYYKTCKIKITVCSESADSIKLRHFDYETAKDKIYDCFGIKE